MLNEDQIHSDLSSKYIIENFEKIKTHTFATKSMLDAYYDNLHKQYAIHSKIEPVNSELITYAQVFWSPLGNVSIIKQTSPNPDHLMKVDIPIAQVGFTIVPLYLEALNLKKDYIIIAEEEISSEIVSHVLEQALPIFKEKLISKLN